MLRLASLLVLNLLCLSLAQAAPLWFADAQGIHRIDTDTSAVVQTIAQDGVQALAPNQKDGTLWALSAARLRKYDAAGATLVDLDLRSLAPQFNSARRLALDPTDETVWIGGGRQLFHLTATGGLIAAFGSPSTIQDMALAQDQSLWVLGQTELSRYSAQALLGRESLAAELQQAAFMAIDDANGTLWLGGARKLFQLAIALPIQVRATIGVDEPVGALALAVDSGTLWASGTSTLFSFTRGGAAATATPLARPAILNPQVLAFDAASRSLWLGHERGLSRFDAAGQFLLTLPAAVRVDAIGAATSGVVPLLTLVSPANGALTNNAFLPIRLHYDASCFGQPCGFPSNVFAAYVLTATLNGQPVGHLFQFDPATNDAVYTPAARHAEGPNDLAAFVTDAEGRRSSTLTARFNVDSIAPAFVNVAPPDGSLFTTSGISIQGSVDDPLASVLLESFSGATIGGPNPAGATFTFLVTLQPGSNAFRLTARDPAGNSRALSRTYVFSTLSLTITSPANGATIDDNKVTVTGTFSGAATATITVNGLPATVAGNSFARADVPLVPGPNTITVVGTSPLGATDTRSISVISAAPGIAITSPANGATVAGESVLVRGTIQAPANSGVSVNGVVAIVDAGNNFYANAVPLQEGSNVVTATVTTPSGKSAAATATVTSSGPVPVVITAKPVQGPAPLTVAFSFENVGGVPLASFGFDPGGPGSQAPGGDPEAFFAWTYPQPGTYQAAVTLFDTAGNAYSQAFAIQAQDPAQMDQMFRAIWNGMNQALLAGDRDRALTYLSAAAREKYGRVFDQLLPHMSEIIGSYSALQRVSIAPRIGEYAINRTIDGVNRIFLIYFVQDENGVWQIDAM